MPNREEILKALQIIKSVCEQHQDCDTCPLSKNEFCVIQEQRPEEWEIKKHETVWRAFEE